MEVLRPVSRKTSELQGLQLPSAVRREAKKQAAYARRREAYFANAAKLATTNVVQVQSEAADGTASPTSIKFNDDVKVYVETLRRPSWFFPTLEECVADPAQAAAAEQAVVEAREEAAAAANGDDVPSPSREDLTVETPRFYDIGARKASTRAVLLDGGVAEVGDVKITRNHGVHEVYLDHIRVSPSHRGLGGARAMLCAALGEATEARNGVRPTTFGLYMLTLQPHAAMHLYIECARLFNFKLVAVLVHGWSVLGYGQDYTKGHPTRAITFYFERDLSADADLPTIMAAPRKRTKTSTVN